MTLYTICVVAFFAVWLIATTLCQTSAEKGIEEKIRRFDPFALIPRWTFFAPNPGTTDHHLLYRDRFAGGVVSAWKEIRLSSRRTLFGALWNPEKRNTKVLTDSVQALIQLSRDIEPQGLKTTLPYIIILNFVASLPRTPLSRATQFLVMESFGYVAAAPPLVVVQSEFHALTVEQPAAEVAA